MLCHEFKIFRGFPLHYFCFQTALTEDGNAAPTTLIDPDLTVKYLQGELNIWVPLPFKSMANICV